MGGVFDQLKRFNVVPPKKQSIKSLRFQTEEIFFDDLKIYVKRKAYRRQMGIYVYPTGKVVVCVNQGASQSQINLFLEAQKNWIRKKLLLFSELKGTHPLKRYVSGEQFCLLSQLYELKIQLVQIRKPSVGLSSSHLILSWPDHLGIPSRKKVEKEIHQFYRVFAIEWMSKRVSFFSSIMGVAPSKLSFRSPKTRWGSCSSRGAVSLNWKLVVAPQEVIDYVVVHELAHLFHPNHSRLYWNCVERFCPYRQMAKQWLNNHYFDMDFLSLRSELHDSSDMVKI